MFPQTIGVDISKAKFDVALYREDTYRMALFDNNTQGFRSFRKWVKNQKMLKSPVCLEATGRYYLPLLLLTSKLLT